jgi:hypothetical protein
MEKSRKRKVESRNQDSPQRHRRKLGKQKAESRNQMHHRGTGENYERRK